MKKIFQFILTSALAVFGCGMVAVFSYQEGLQIFSVETVRGVFWMVEISSPIIAVLVLSSWVFKWPAPATWGSLSLGVVAMASWLYTTSSLMYIYNVNILPVRTTMLIGVFLLSLLGGWLLCKHIKTKC